MHRPIVDNRIPKGMLRQKKKIFTFLYILHALVEIAFNLAIMLTIWNCHFSKSPSTKFILFFPKRKKLVKNKFVSDERNPTMLIMKFFIKIISKRGCVYIWCTSCKMWKVGLFFYIFDLNLQRKAATSSHEHCVHVCQTIVANYNRAKVICSLLDLSSCSIFIQLTSDQSSRNRCLHSSSIPSTGYFQRPVRVRPAQHMLRIRIRTHCLCLRIELA